MIVVEGMRGDTELPQIIATGKAVGGCTDLLNRRQDQSHEHDHNGNDHQRLD
jgi:hypothetical protein